MAVYKGSCHCGGITFEVEGELGQAIECNCSICRRRGALHWFVPREQLKLARSEPAATSYKWNKKVIDWQFCPTCGCGAYAEGVDQSGNRIAAVNVRCLDGVDLSALKIMPFNGRDR